MGLEAKIQETFLLFCYENNLADGQTPFNLVTLTCGSWSEGQHDLYFTVQWFWLISWRLFDVAQSVECPFWGTGDHMFNPGLWHTKVVKNGTTCSCASLGTQTYGVELGVVDSVRIMWLVVVSCQVLMAFDHGPELCLKERKESLPYQTLSPVRTPVCSPLSGWLQTTLG